MFDITHAPVNVYPHYPLPGLPKVKPGDLNSSDLPHKKPLPLGQITDQIPYFRDSTFDNTTNL